MTVTGTQYQATRVREALASDLDDMFARYDTDQ